VEKVDAGRATLPPVYTWHGVEISPTEVLRNSTLRPWVKKVGEVTGFEQVTGLYTLRRAAGKELDSSGIATQQFSCICADVFPDLGTVSDSLRNLIMQHRDLGTFQKYYLSRYINMQAIFRRLPVQDTLLESMSRTIDQRRPRRPKNSQN